MNWLVKLLDPNIVKDEEAIADIISEARTEAPMLLSAIKNIVTHPTVANAVALEAEIAADYSRIVNDVGVIAGDLGRIGIHL